MPKLILDERSQITLDSILVKDVSELLDHEKSFLRARVVYLNGDQRKEYASALGASKSPINPSKAEVPETSYKKLQAQASKLGIKCVGVKADELKVLVAQAMAE